jgi:hypothetical protein
MKDEYIESVWKQKLAAWWYGTLGIVTRWILVFPLAFIASTITGYFAFILTSAIMMILPDGWEPNVLAMVRYLFCPITFVTIGAKVAPDYQFITAVVLATMWSMVMIMGFFRQGYSHFELVCTILAVFGSVAGAAQAADEIK